MQGVPPALLALMSATAGVMVAEAIQTQVPYRSVVVNKESLRKRNPDWLYGEGSHGEISGVQVFGVLD